MQNVKHLPCLLRLSQKVDQKPTAKVLMNTLLNCKEVFDEEFFTRGERDLADDERVLVAQMRQEMQRLCESDE